MIKKINQFDSDLKFSFIEFLRIEKRISEDSIKAYVREIENLFNSCEENILRLKKYSEVSAIIRDTAIRRNLAKNTVNKIADFASVFYTWAFREGHIEHNPLQFGHEFGKDTNVKQKYINDPLKVMEMLRSHPLHNNRDECIYRLLLSSGIRRKELCDLNIKDCHLDKRFINVIEGKGGQFRVAYICEETKGHLDKYIEGLKTINYNGNALFFNERYERMKPNSLTKWMIRRSRQVGISDVIEYDHITPHMFRHTVGRIMRKNGAPLEDIADVLGHKSLSSTRIYATCESEQVQKRFDQFNKIA